MRTLLLFGVASVSVTAAPVPKEFDQTFAVRYGKANPIDKDCTVEAKGRDLRIAIQSGDHWGLGDDGHLRMPHVAKEVAGDFVLTVSTEIGELPEHGKFEFAHYQAGVYLQSGADVSFQLAVQHNRSHLQSQTTGAYSVRKPGTSVSGCEDAHFDQPSVRMKLERKGEVVTAAVLTAKGRWETVRECQLPLKKAVAVGLFVGGSGKPFAATFAGYEVKPK